MSHDDNGDSASQEMITERLFDDSVTPPECDKCSSAAEYFLPGLDDDNEFDGSWALACKQQLITTLAAWKSAGVAAPYFELKKTDASIPNYMKGDKYCRTCGSRKSEEHVPGKETAYVCWYCESSSKTAP